MASTTIFSTIWPQTSSDYALWVAALGSLLVVIVALFGDKLQRLMFKPLLRIKADTKTPYVERTLEKTTSGSIEFGVGRREG